MFPGKLMLSGFSLTEATRKKLVPCGGRVRFDYMTGFH
jgi:hypothetical protein